MHFQFSFKHMDSSQALQNYAEEKLRERIDKFVTKAISAHVAFSVMRHECTVHLKLEGGDGFHVQVEHTSADMYGAIDELVVKLTTQLKKHKEKLKDHKGVKLAQNLPEVASIAPGDTIDATDIIKFEQGRRRAAGR